MKVVTVVGARPQFVKAAAVTPVLRKSVEEILVHTGQHYDYQMSQVFFDQLHLPVPDYNLGIGSGSHGTQTGAMLAAIEKVLMEEKPDTVLVYGDTNSTLAAALAAVKLHIPVLHVEAGLRAFNLEIPEEVNRVLTDHSSSLLCAPTQAAMGNLAREGLQDRAVFTGDVMADILYAVARNEAATRQTMTRLGLQERGYMLLTLHRPGNVDDPDRLKQILEAVSKVELDVLFPIHPRTRGNLKRLGLEGLVQKPPFKCVEPLGYAEMVAAEASAVKILTDSGGVQKEAYLLGVPCVTLREETEWVETVKAGWNRLVGSDPQKIREAVTWIPEGERPPFFGDGHASEEVVKALLDQAQGRSAK